MVAITGKDDNGSVREAGIQKDRLKVRSVSTDEVLFAVQEGRGFQTYTAEITLNGATKQMVFFIKNNDVAPILITSATIGSSVTTGGTDNISLLEQVGNIQPADPIVVSGTDLLITNRKSGDPRPFVGDAKKGPQALGGSEVFATGLLADFTSGKTFDLSTELPKGGSSGIAVRPPAGNTSMVFTLSVSFHVINGI